MEELSLTPLSKSSDPWLVQMQPESIAFVPPPGQGETIHIAHADRVQQLEVIGLLGKQSVLVVYTEERKKKYQFKLTPEENERIDAWLGPPTEQQLSIALKRRYAFALPIAVVFIITALPMPADPEQGLDAEPGNPFSVALGAGLMILWLVARLRPHPYLFLLDSAWFVLLALKLAADVLQGGASPIWLLWIGLIIPIVLSGWNNFKRFSSYRAVERPV